MVSVYGAMTDERKARIWLLWRQGRPMIEIARDIIKPPATVYSYLLYHGGIEPRTRSRRVDCLSLTEREVVSRGLACKRSIRSIARELGRSPSTISREIKRNGGLDRYRACDADNAFVKRSRRPKQCLLNKNDQLKSIVIDKLRANWSPEQISGWLKKCIPEDAKMHISHETIYRSLFRQSKGVLCETLKKHLRTRRMFRQARSHRSGHGSRMDDTFAIRYRPAEVEGRTTPGHWEGDLIIGSNNSAIATVVERHSRFTLLCKVENKTTSAVVTSLAIEMGRLPQNILKSLTWDRGVELAAHKALTRSTGIAVYFCDPSSPWQRGTNENTNGLLRQYFPKKTTLAKYSQQQLNDIAEQLNSRPRKTLGFKTPAEVFNQVLQ